MSKIIVVGGGASGMICAIEASKKHDVLVIEKNNKLGKKLLLTGNGKCNYTNLNLTTDNIPLYYNNDFYKTAYQKFNNNMLVDYLKNIGIEPHIFERDGFKYIYPITNKSKDVYYCLYNVILNSKIDIIYNEKVIDINTMKDSFQITTDKNKYFADKVVVATGGKSYIKTGSDGFMFEVLNKNGYNINTPLPALCGIESDNKIFKMLDSFRSFLKVKLYIDDKFIDEYCGEVQFNNYGLSGIPIMNMSSKISRNLYKNKNIYVSLDFLFEILDTKDLNNVKLYLTKRKEILYNLKTTEFLSGIIDYRLANCINDILNIDKNKLINDLTVDEIEKFVDILTNMKIYITKTRDFDEAQIITGGVDTNQIDCNDFQSKLHKGLYFTGEVIDVDGICGGFNLQFAFGSGYIVGNSI